MSASFGLSWGAGIEPWEKSSSGASKGVEETECRCKVGAKQHLGYRVR